MRTRRKTAIVILGALTLSLGACSDGGSKNQSSTTEANPQLTGVVEAPGGQVAFNRPGLLGRLLASIFGSSAVAAIEGVAPVGAGVNIQLIEVDANGDQVGLPLAETTTGDGGVYAIVEPTGFMPGPKYVIRAAGNTGNMDVRVSGEVNDVNPVADAVSDLIASNVSELDKLTSAEVDEIADAVAELVQNVDPTGLDSAQLSDAFKSECSANEEFNNIIDSSTAPGQICGHVADSSGNAVAGVNIIVRDYGNWVTRATAKTDTAGDYCVNVPAAGSADPYITGRTLSGDYILGAINRTDTSMAASQWWTDSSASASDGSGGANSQFGAGKVSVADATPLSKNFILLAGGARVQGSVTNSVDNGAVEGANVLLREYDTFMPLTSGRVQADGNYRVNVKPGDYMLSFLNRTRLPYASEIYRQGTSGAYDRNMASRETLAANTVYTYDAVLEPGVAITGTVTDNTGTAVPGQVVTIANADSGRIERLRANREGKFRLMVNPRLDPALPIPYYVQARGQNVAADTNGADDNTPTAVKGLLLNAPTTEIKGKLLAADGTTPISQAVMQLRDTVAYNNVSLEVSASDGTFSVYTDTAADYVLQARMDNNPTYGTGQLVSSGNMGYVSFVNALATTVGSPLGDVIDLGTLTMPTLGDTVGVGYLDGNAGTGGASLSICLTGATCGKNGRLTSTQARGDGSFKISLPAGTYTSLGTSVNGVTGTGCSNITILNGKTSTVSITQGSGCNVTNAQ